MRVQVTVKHTIQHTGCYELEVTEEEYADTQQLLNVIKSGEYISMQPMSSHIDAWDVHHIATTDHMQARRA